MHHSRNTFVNVPSLFLWEMQDVEGIVGKLHVFIVINWWDGCLSLADKVVVIDVVRQKAFFLQSRNCLLEHLIKDVIWSFNFLLKSDARLFKQISLNVTSSQLSLDIEVNSNELSLQKMCCSSVTFVMVIKIPTNLRILKSCHSELS